MTKDRSDAIVVTTRKDGVEVRRIFEPRDDGDWDVIEKTRPRDGAWCQLPTITVDAVEVENGD